MSTQETWTTVKRLPKYSTLVRITRFQCFAQFVDFSVAKRSGLGRWEGNAWPSECSRVTDVIGNGTRSPCDDWTADAPSIMTLS